MTPRERAEAAVLVRQQGPRVVDVQSDTHIVLMRSHSVPDAEVRAGWLRDMIERAILADRAEQAAGEAERVREAVAREREECAQACKGWTTTTVGDQYAHGCAARIRARATSPVPEPVIVQLANGRTLDVSDAQPAAPVASAKRSVVEAAEFGAHWYAYDPETGYDTFNTAEEAQRAAEQSLDSYRDESTEGWRESVDEVEWGLLVPHGETRQCDVVDAEDDPSIAARGFDFVCDYRLCSVRSAAVDALAAARKGAT